MKRTLRLSESDLKRIISRVVNENINDNTLYRDIMDVLSSSNASREEKKDILKMILDEMGTADDIRSRIREPKPSYMSRLRGDRDEDRWKEFR